MGDLIELTTPQDEYDFFKVTSAMKFYLKGKGWALITLILNPNDTSATWIMIGNEYSCIAVHTLQKVETKNIISEHTYKPFWISWYQNKIKIGEGNNPKPFLVGKEFINCNNIKILLSSSETMFWKFRLPHVVKPHKYKRISGGQLKWVKMDGNCLPEDAFIGGYENEVLYIMRAMHEEALTPGKFMPSKGAGYVAWGYDAHKKNDMEVLCGYNGVWLRTIDDKIPEGAVEGGYSEVEHETLYVGRAMFDGHLIPGKVQPSHKVCYIAYDEETISKSAYEILVGLNQSILCGYHGIWVPNEGDRIPAGAFIGGYTEYHEIMFVGRAIHNNIIIPGKIAPSHKILCGYDGIWVPTEEDKIPAGAFVGGYTEYDETMFVGRALHNEKLIPGKIAPSHNVCYIPYNGKEISKPKYEILVVPLSGNGK